MAHQLPYSLLSPTPNLEGNTPTNTAAYLTTQPDSIDLDKIKGTFQHSLTTPSKPSNTTPYQSPLPSYIIGNSKENDAKEINYYQTPPCKVLFMDEFLQSEQRLSQFNEIATAVTAPRTSILNSLLHDSPDTAELCKGKLTAKKCTKRKICCSCQKSRCLKLYCDCFAYGLYCEGCNCVECMNRKECEDERRKAMTSIKDRNPLHNLNSDLQIDEKPSNKAYFKGCQCKKSNCRKKYCECYLAKKACTEQCKCEGCLNHNNCEEAAHMKIATPVLLTPFSDCKSTCSTQKSKKKHVSSFVPELYSNFTKKYSVQPVALKKRLRYKS